MTSATIEDDGLTVPDTPEQLLRTSGPAPVGGPPAPPAEDGDDLDAEQPPARRGAGAPSGLGRYLAYAGCFVGAGLISGGLVHLPLDRVRYLTLALVGVAVFLVATLVQEVVLAPARPSHGRLATVLAGSLLLSLGIGMLSGGVQHFAELPQRGAVLVPAGVVVSFLGFTVRAGAGARALLSRSAVVVAGVAVVVAVGLHWLAAAAPEDGGHGHGHGATGPAAAGAHAEPAGVADSDAEPAGAADAPAEPAHAEPAHAEPAHAEPAHAEPAVPDPVRDDADLQRQLEELAALLAELEQAGRR